MPVRASNHFLYRGSPEGQDTSLICLNGHVLTDRWETDPYARKARCPDCGSSTIHTCPKCQNFIPGYFHTPGVVSISMMKAVPPKFCDSCGESFPWTGRKASKTETQAISETPRSGHGIAKAVAVGVAVAVIAGFALWFLNLNGDRNPSGATTAQQPISITVSPTITATSTVNGVALPKSATP